MTIPTLEPRAAYALWAASYPAYAHNPVMQAEERAMLALLPADLSGMTVVDAGCGSGRYMLHALRRGAAHVMGVDLSPEMLAVARLALDAGALGERASLAEGDLAALPIADALADVTVSGLVVGHVASLDGALAELVRVTRPGGLILCSDMHPTGAALGWRRDFKAGGGHFAARHTIHVISHWLAGCDAHGLVIEAVHEPMLDPADIPPGARFDPVAVEIPVALVVQLRRLP